MITITRIYSTGVNSEIKTNTTISTKKQYKELLEEAKKFLPEEGLVFEAGNTCFYHSIEAQNAFTESLEALVLDNRVYLVEIPTEKDEDGWEWADPDPSKVLPNIEGVRQFKGESFVFEFDCQMISDNQDFRYWIDTPFLEWCESVEYDEREEHNYGI